MYGTEDLAASVGASNAAIRLLLGQLFAYPMMLIYRSYLTKQSATLQHLYIVFFSMCIAYWSFGASAILHSMICILVSYGLLFFLRPTFITSLIVFIFNMVYLLVGYFANSSESYDLSWTMPHCVLCLRLIAVAIDLYDGAKPEDSLSAEQMKYRLLKMPSLLELFSQCFFVGGYFVGPQFSMRKYQDFIQRNITQDLRPPISFGLMRCFLGFVYLLIHVIASHYVPLEYVSTDEFLNMNFWSQSFWYSCWVKGILSKYIGVWLFSEGAFVLSGLSYNGKDSNEQPLWNGGANVKLRLFESAAKFGDIIASFNCNTNNWVAIYIYKRLKFLGNRFLSQFITLWFLALWHGIHSGYYLTFFNEFIVMNFEKDMEAIVKKSHRIQEWLKLPGASPIMWVVGKLYVLFFLPHCFLPFALLQNSKYIPVLFKTRGILYIVFLLWPIYSIPLKKALIPKQVKSEVDTKKTS
ncbi:lysophospholipid acyltransferase 5 [Lepeophtheirus salmonis]|uniref:lysophospholipid acyltransferase 5 n=1 Tax=Lepeophtheirus salmonis TaxID=72036 RepID=UPI001AE2E7BC|nr:lysophospholipid acyltransferase 5-like [Lepeophtheirus salmonis]